MKQWMINFTLLLLSLMAIVIALFKVTPFEVTEDTYIGVTVTLLALATSFVIGYQIYNAIELKKEISEQRKQYGRIVQKSLKMDKRYKEQNYRMQEGFDILSSLIYYNSGQRFIVCSQAFSALHHALVSSIKTNRTDYEWIFSYLRLYISQFNWQTFSSGLYLDKDKIYRVSTVGEDHGRSLNSIIEVFLAPIKEDEQRLRADKNFCKIQCEYNRVMKILYDRINSILKDPMKELSPEERDEIVNPKY